MKSYPSCSIFKSIKAFSGQCNPRGTKNGYSRGIAIAKINGAFEFSHESPIPSKLPPAKPIGPRTKAVTGTITIIEINGIKTSWTD